MIHELLKKETAHNHRAIEDNSLLKMVMNPQLTEELYVRILTKLLDWHKAMEPKLVEYNSKHNILEDLNQRLKCSKLILDLEELKANYMQKEMNVMEINSAEVFFGVLYVIEGATLGSQFILPKLQVSLPNLQHLYYKGYSNDTQIMWKLFIKNLTDNEGNLMTEKVIESANNTFYQLRANFTN